MKTKRTLCILIIIYLQISFLQAHRTGSDEDLHMIAVQQALIALYFNIEPPPLSYNSLSLQNLLAKRFVGKHVQEIRFGKQCLTGRYLLAERTYEVEENGGRFLVYYFRFWEYEANDDIYVDRYSVSVFVDESDFVTAVDVSSGSHPVVIESTLPPRHPN